jgi:hypothetical protein
VREDVPEELRLERGEFGLLARAVETRLPRRLEDETDVSFVLLKQRRIDDHVVHKHLTADTDEMPQGLVNASLMRRRPLQRPCGMTVH